MFTLLADTYFRFEQDMRMQEKIKLSLNEENTNGAQLQPELAHFKNRTPFKQNSKKKKHFQSLYTKQKICITADRNEAEWLL